MPTTRFDMRLDQEIKAKAEKASALLGLKSLTEYIVKLIDDNATQVIAQHESIIVENDIFDLLSKEPLENKFHLPQNLNISKPIRMLFFGDMMLDRHVGELIN